jgi:hypothetical protein
VACRSVGWLFSSGRLLRGVRVTLRPGVAGKRKVAPPMSSPRRAWRFGQGHRPRARAGPDDS